MEGQSDQGKNPEKWPKVKKDGDWFKDCSLPWIYIPQATSWVWVAPVWTLPKFEKPILDLPQYYVQNIPCLPLNPTICSTLAPIF